MKGILTVLLGWRVSLEETAFVLSNLGLTAPHLNSKSEAEYWEERIFRDEEIRGGIFEFEPPSLLLRTITESGEFLTREPK